MIQCLRFYHLMIFISWGLVVLYLCLFVNYDIFTLGYCSFLLTIIFSNACLLQCVDFCLCLILAGVIRLVWRSFSLNPVVMLGLGTRS